MEFENTAIRMNYLRDRLERTILAHLLSLLPSMPNSFLELPSSAFWTVEYRELFESLRNEYQNRTAPVTLTKHRREHCPFEPLIREIEREPLSADTDIESIIHLLRAPISDNDEFLYSTLIHRLRMRYNGIDNDSLPPGMHLTDFGNADRFKFVYGHNIKFDQARRKWMIWDGMRWTIDDLQSIEEFAKSTVRGIYEEVKYVSTVAEQAALGQFAKRSSSKGRIADLIALNESINSISIRTRDFDQDPMLFNLDNGTYDFINDCLRPHRRHDLISKTARYRFDADGTCPEWMKFLSKTFNENLNLITSIQQCLGYSLTGLVNEQCMFFCYGGGSNGKSTFLEVTRMILGDYWQKGPTEMLMAKRQDSIPNDMARMQGARMVVISETQAGRHLNEAKLKDLTGSDTITARFLHKEYFQFSPTHKIWMQGNHKPIIRGTDEGIWRRIWVIPFTVKINSSERRPFKEMIDVFRTELPGIFNWCLEGLRSYMKQGLQQPEAVRLATEDYRSDMDIIGNYLTERCLLNPNVKIHLKTLYDNFKTWCEEQGESILGKQQFHLHIKSRGFQSIKGNGNVQEVVGIQLKDFMNG